MSCVRGCCETQADHYRAVVVRPTVSPQRAAERTEAADMSAYKRLRANGVQPKGIAGSAGLEREAKSTFEIERGFTVKDDRLRRRFEAAHADMPANVI